MVISRRPDTDCSPVIDDAETAGLLHPHTGSRIFEGTVGSTGISIATIARARLLLHFQSDAFFLKYLSEDMMSVRVRSLCPGLSADPI